MSLSDINFKNLEILIFAWNAGGKKICKNELKQNNKDVIKSDCIIPNFMINFSQKINQYKPKIFVIVTEDESESNTYFHSDYLENVFIKNINKNNKNKTDNYKFIKREKINDSFTYTTINNNKINTSVRISIYGKNIPNFSNIFTKVITMKQNEYYTGACAIYLTYLHENYCFIATKFLSNMDEKLNLDFETYRFANIQFNNLYMINIKNKLLDNTDINLKPNKIYIIGDLDYIVNSYNDEFKYNPENKKKTLDYLFYWYNFKKEYEKIKPTSDNKEENNNLKYFSPEEDGFFIDNEYTNDDNKNSEIKEYLNYLKLNDELSIELNNKNNLILKDFKEGIQNNGPAFLYPEYKLLTTRDSEKIEDSNYDLKGKDSPSFNNRIIYNSDINCKLYENYQHGTMYFSESSGIIGLYY